jgi:hypothetical protein
MREKARIAGRFVRDLAVAAATFQTVSRQSAMKMPVIIE